MLLIKGDTKGTNLFDNILILKISKVLAINISFFFVYCITFRVTDNSVIIKPTELESERRRWLTVMLANLIDFSVLAKSFNDIER